MFHNQKEKELGEPVPKRRYTLTQYPAVTPTVIEPKRFLPTDTKAIVNHIKEEGYAIVSSILDTEEQKRLSDLFQEYVAQSTMNHSDRWPGDTNKGKMKYYGVGQSSFMWHLRTLPQLRTIWEAYFGSSSLLTDFQGPIAYRHSVKWKPTLQQHEYNQRKQPELQTVVVVSSSEGASSTWGCIRKSHLRYNASLTDSLLPRDHYWYQYLEANPTSLVTFSQRPGDAIFYDGHLITTSFSPTTGKAKTIRPIYLAGQIGITSQPHSLTPIERAERMMCCYHAWTSCALPPYSPTHIMPAKNHKACITPPSCFRLSFTPLERRLLYGT